MYRKFKQGEKLTERASSPKFRQTRLEVRIQMLNMLLTYHDASNWLSRAPVYHLTCAVSRDRYVHWLPLPKSLRLALYFRRNNGYNCMIPDAALMSRLLELYCTPVCISAVYSYWSSDSWIQLLVNVLFLTNFWQQKQ